MSVLPAITIAILSGWLWPPPDATYQPALLALGALAPDLERALGAFSPRFAARVHRSIGHSLPVLVAWGALLAASFHALDPRPGIGTAFALAGIGLGVHVLVDLASPTGLALLGRRRHALGLFAPQDVSLVVLPVLALGLGVGWPEARLVLAIGTLLLLLYVTGLRMTMRRRAERLAQDAFGASLLGVYPTPWSPFRWLAICASDDSRSLALVDVAKRKVGEPHRFESPPPSPLVDAFASTGALVARRRDGWVVDLRYAYAWPVPPSGYLCDAEGDVRRIHLP